VIVGGESGRDARPMHPYWPRAIRDQCNVAAVPFLFKQWGEWSEFANEDHYTHCSEERHAHAWVDARTGQHGLCWLVDDQGVWSNHTGEPPTDENGQISDDIAVMGWVGKTAAGRELDAQQYDESPESASAQASRLIPMPA
jgi:hypothetical protein